MNRSKRVDERISRRDADPAALKAEANSSLEAVSKREKALMELDALEGNLANLLATGGALTGLVNNAAGNFISRTEDLSIKGFEAITNIVFKGTFMVTLGCGKRWLAEGISASVVSITARNAQNGGPFTAPSSMAKAASSRSRLSSSLPRARSPLTAATARSTKNCSPRSRPSTCR